MPRTLARLPYGEATKPVEAFNFEEGNVQKVCEVHVLDYTANTFAFDDRLYTTTFESIETNVLDNDAFGVTAGCVYVGQPNYGTVVEDPGIDGLDKPNYNSGHTDLSSI